MWGPSPVARALLAVALSVCCACSAAGDASPGAAVAIPRSRAIPGSPRRRRSTARSATSIPTITGPGMPRGCAPCARRHVARGRAPRRPTARGRAGSRRPAPKPERRDGDLDRALDLARAARRRQFPHRSELGRPHRSLRRVDRRGAVHPASHAHGGSAADRLRADLPRPLRPPRRADGACTWRACSIRASSCHSASSPGWPTAESPMRWSSTGASRCLSEGLRIVCTPAQHGSGRTLARPGPTALVLVGGARIEAVLLRRGYRLLRPLQGDRRRARAVRPGRAARSDRIRRGKSRAPSTSRPRRPCRR